MTERLFLALWPNDQLRSQLVATRDALTFQGGRPVAADNLHVTLVFLGNQDAERRQCIEKAVSDVRAARFTFALTEVEWRRRTGILWFVGNDEPLLLALVTSLQAALTLCGHAPETRRFRPHVTLARDVRQGPRRQPIAPIHWTADDISLVSSRQGRSGSQYTVERRWPLS